MKPTATLRPSSIPSRRWPALALVASALAACATTPDPCQAPPPPPIGPSTAGTISFASGTGTIARVTRVVAPDGSETLHGETELLLGTTSRRCVVEDVSLDARGSLVRADVSTAATCGAAPETRSHLDPTGEGSREASAWIYTPEAFPGHAVTTPVAAWVAFRAAAVSPSLTLIELERRKVWRVPRDQVVVPTEIGATVVLGNDGADVRAGFVEELRMTDYGVTLVRVPGTS
jgi:hypothetical protein